MKAYQVEQSRKGVTYLLVWAETARAAVAKVRDEGMFAPGVMVVETQDEPGGIRSVRRDPNEDS